MPRGDGTGPWGTGFGRGGGFSGGGRGWRNRFYATGLPGWARAGDAAPYRKPDVEAEKHALKSRADALESELDSIRKRLNEIEPGAGTK
jgi:hypothetical protein